MRQKPSFGARLRYAFDNFMAKGGLAVFLALLSLFAAAMLVTTGLRWLVNLWWPDEAFADTLNALWIQFLQITDAGAVAEDGDSHWLNRLIGIVSMVLGLVLFSSLVAFITSLFEAKMEELRQGRSDVLEEGHTLILGFGDRVLEIIRELVIANESESRPAIVVLADRPKTELDEFFADRLDNLKNTRLITREGPTSSLPYLRRAGVLSARSVVILNSAPDDAPPHEKALADARVLKTILAVNACTGEEALPPLVAELHLPAKQALARQIVPGKVFIMDDQSILAKLMVQTSRISGLAKVYDRLVGFEGCEFYFHTPELSGPTLTYRDLVFLYQDSTVLGLRQKGVLRMNPPADTVLAPGDEAVLLAEDDSAIRSLKTPVSYKAPGAAPAGPQPRGLERELIVGWSLKASVMVEEYSQYLGDGSVIDLLVPEAPEGLAERLQALQKAHPHLTIGLITGELSQERLAGEIHPETYDNVLLLAGDGGEAEVRDSETIATLLEFRSYFRSRGGAGRTQMITEVADSDNIEIIEDAGVKDFLISNQFVSRIYAQVSEDPGVLQIYEDLFGSSGSELYLKPAAWYLGKTGGEYAFADLCAAALARGETCLGLRFKALAENHGADYGIVLNPSKDRVFAVGPDDWLITLAEDER